jgi:hypothetical protein
MAISFKQFFDGIRVKAKAVLTSDTQGELEVDSTTGKLSYHNGTARSPIVTETSTATLTNKTLTSPAITSPTGIVKADVGLGNVDNTSDATKNSAVATLTNKSIDGLSNTLTNVTATTNANLTGPVTSVGNATSVTAGAITSAMIASSTIVDSNVSATAAIARTKLASGTNNALQANSSSGVLSDITDITVGTNNITLANTKHLERQAQTDSTTTGSNATLSAFTASAVRLTNVSLTSLANIPAGNNGQEFILFNRTGATVNIIDASSAIGTANARILTGTGTAITVAPNAALILSYDSTTANWQVVGGSGSGSGNIPYVVATGTSDVITANFFPSITAYTDGLTVLVGATSSNTTTAPTINVNSLGAKTITKGNNQLLVAGDIISSNHEMLLTYNSSLGVFVLHNPKNYPVADTVVTNANLTGPVTSVGNATTITNSSVTNAMLAGSIDLTSKVTGTLPILNGGTGVTSATTSPTTSAFAAWDSNKNLSANNHLEGFTSTVTAAGTTTLVTGSAYAQTFTGTTTQTVVLPVVTTLVNGFQFQITNLSTGVVTIQTSGANTLIALASNTQAAVTCINTAGGTGTSSWSYAYSAVQTSTIGSFTNPMTTGGDLIVGGASGAPNRLANGTVGQILTSAGGTSAPSWSTLTPSLNTIVQLKADEGTSVWSTGNNATILGGGTIAGTFVINTSTPLNGLNSYSYTQAAGSLNDYLMSATQAVNLKFRGQQVYLTFPFQYNGNTSDIQIIVYDATNSAIISTTSDVVTGTNGSTNTAIVGCIIPLTCTSIRLGFQVKVLNSGKLLTFDDLQLATDIYPTNNVANITGPIAWTPTFSAGFGTVSSVSAFYEQVGDRYKVWGSFTSGTITSSIAQITVPWIFNTTYLDSTGTLIGSINTSGSATNATPEFAQLMILGQSTNTISVTNVVSGTTLYNNTAVPANSVFNSTTRYSFSFEAPISGISAYSPSVVVPNQQVSSDTMNFAFKSTAITTSDPIGTFNTYYYNSGSNTPNLSSTSPTQTTSSMNTNGVQLFARGYGSSSTASSPSRLDIVVGTGLKSYFINLYGGTGKTLASSPDRVIFSTSQGGTSVSYNELTGILSLDCGLMWTTTITTAFVDTLGSYTTGYFVINASKSPSLTALPNLLPRIAYLSEQQTSGTQGGSSVATTWTTRTLNTLVDSTGIVSSLSSNQFTLPAGTYRATATSWITNGNGVMIRLRNITDSTTVVSGKTYQGSITNTYSNADLDGEFTITSSKTFALQYYATSATATTGLGAAVSSGEVERYSQIAVQKIK